jgi:tetratricopeptide (TPR) repeat protein
MIDNGNRLKSLAKESNLYGNYSLEINYLKALIALNKTNNPVISLNLAHAYFNNNQLNNASTHYEQLITHSEDFNIKSKALLQLGVIDAYKFRYYIDQQNNQKAELHYNKALLFFKNALIANPANNEARYNFELLKIHPLKFKKPNNLRSATPPKKTSSPNKKQPNKQNQENEEGKKIPGGEGGTDFKPDDSGTEKQPSPTSKQGNGEGKQTIPSKESDAKSSKKNPGKADNKGTIAGGLEHKNNGQASDKGESGKIKIENKIQKEKPQLNKDQLKKMNLSLPAAEKLLNNMKMAEKQYIQQQQKKANLKHQNKNESRW